MGPGAPTDPVWCCRQKKYAAGFMKRWWKVGLGQFSPNEGKWKKAATKIVGWWVLATTRVYETASTSDFWLANILSFCWFLFNFWTYRNPLTDIQQEIKHQKQRKVKTKLCVVVSSHPYKKKYVRQMLFLQFGGWNTNKTYLFNHLLTKQYHPLKLKDIVLFSGGNPSVIMRCSCKVLFHIGVET